MPDDWVEELLAQNFTKVKTAKPSPKAQPRQAEAKPTPKEDSQVENVFIDKGAAGWWYVMRNDEKLASVRGEADAQAELKRFLELGADSPEWKPE